MNTLEINRIIKNNPILNKYYCGIYPSDLLPDNPQKPCYFVVNTDPAYLPGKHWIVIHIDKFGKIEYFDSFGRAPLQRNFVEFIQKYGKSFIYNKEQIQSNTSTTCGKFCILYIAFRANGLSMKEIISLFSTDTEYNEMLLKNLYKKLI